MPGSWGTFKRLPVRADAATMLQEMGIHLLRFGGSYVSASGMEWKVIMTMLILIIVSVCEHAFAFMCMHLFRCLCVLVCL